MTKHRVLIVDDYPETAETASMLLTLMGHECRFETTGAGGLRAAAELLPDIAILDIGLPDLSGFELARELRKQLAGRPIYLAAVTGWGQPEDRVKALAAGFDHHVVKPADRAKLASIIDLAEQQLAVTAPAGGRSPA